MMIQSSAERTSESFDEAASAEETITIEHTDEGTSVSIDGSPMFELIAFGLFLVATVVAIYMVRRKT